MSRSLLLVTLLLVTGVVSADELPEAERGDGPVERQTQGDVPEAQGETDAEDAKAKDSVPEADDLAGADEAQAQAKGDAKLISGMSILGNQEAPKSLVIVPWKGSVLGDSLGISTMLDDSKQPIDREVFMRALSYYEIRSEAKP